jgi:hypothetical protein
VIDELVNAARITRTVAIFYNAKSYENANTALQLTRLYLHSAWTLAIPVGSRVHSEYRYFCKRSSIFGGGNVLGPGTFIWELCFGLYRGRSLQLDCLLHGQVVAVPYGWYCADCVKTQACWNSVWLLRLKSSSQWYEHVVDRISCSCYSHLCWECDFDLRVSVYVCWYICPWSSTV